MGSCCTKKRRNSESDLEYSDNIYTGAPSSGSNFCIRPLTTEKPKTVTALSTIKPTKEKETS